MTQARLVWIIAGCVAVYTAGELAFAWLIMGGFTAPGGYPTGWHP